MATPDGRWGNVPDPAAPVVGWPALASEIEGLRAKTGAGWFGTASYGVTAQLADEAAVGVPIVQLSERDRWTGANPGGPPNLERPGLVVDLSRRLSQNALQTCFREVRSLGTVTRGAGGLRSSIYAVYLVSGPKRDVLRRGC